MKINKKKNDAHQNDTGLYMRIIDAGRYKSNVIDSPKADSWFYMNLVVDGDWITAYVNYSCIPRSIDRLIVKIRMSLPISGSIKLLFLALQSSLPEHNFYKLMVRRLLYIF